MPEFPLHVEHADASGAMDRKAERTWTEPSSLMANSTSEMRPGYKPVDIWYTWDKHSHAKCATVKDVHVSRPKCCWIFCGVMVGGFAKYYLLCTSHFLGFSPRNKLRFTEWYRRKIGDSFGILPSTLGWIKQVLPCLEPLLRIDGWSHLFSHVLFLQVMRCWPCVFKRKLCSLKNQHKVKWAHWARHNFNVSQLLWRAMLVVGNVKRQVETRNAHFSRDIFEKESFLLNRCPTRLAQGSDQWDCFQEHISYISLVLTTNDRLTALKLPSILPRLQWN